MSDSQRYITIPESTFSTWFSLSPSNDPCTVKEYELIKPDAKSKIELTGSFGNYAIKIDKSFKAMTQQVTLRAITRGLVFSDQVIEFVVCPKRGGFNLVVDQLNIYSMVDLNARGSAANVNFPVFEFERSWYEGCGSYERYSVTAEDSSTQSIL
jgi:hypothetical protein